MSVRNDAPAAEIDTKGRPGPSTESGVPASAARPASNVAKEASPPPKKVRRLILVITVSTNLLPGGSGSVGGAGGGLKLRIVHSVIGQGFGALNAPASGLAVSSQGRFTVHWRESTISP